MSLSTVAFDVSSLEIYGALLNGGKLVLMNSDIPAIQQIGETIRQKGVTSICVTPVLLNLLLEECSSDLQGLRQISCGGDVLPVWLARKCITTLRTCELMNAYGPTENSVDTTCYHVRDVPDNATSIPIGRPIANDCVFILDQHLQPVPIGVVGELYVSGYGIARGYLNNPRITQECFIPDPFSVAPGGRLYKTGDLARYRSDRNIEYLGRADQQVKIRGCRVEPGEIETTLSAAPGVRQTVVTAYERDNQPTELVAYVVLESGIPFDPTKLRSHVKERLPEYMVPAHFVEVEEVPMTPSGKVDRKKLPVPISTFRQEVVLPARNPIEERILAIWEEILGVQEIGVNQNFFDLGGHSLLAMRMFSEIEKAFHVRLPVSSIFAADTVERLARRVASMSPDETDSSLVVMQPAGSKTPLFCVHDLYGEVVPYRHLVSHLGIERPIYGFRYSEQKDCSQVRIEGLAAKYVLEMKRIQPSGPYLLVGHSLGGVIAFEMAQQLNAGKDAVQLLSILDTKNPARYLRELPLWKRIVNGLNSMAKSSPKRWSPFVILKISNLWQRLRRKQSIHQGMVEPWHRVLADAMASYEPVPFHGELLLFRAAEQRIDDVLVDEKLGWGTLAAEGVDVNDVPGNHRTILEEPNVQHLARRLGTYMDTLGV